MPAREEWKLREEDGHRVVLRMGIPGVDQWVELEVLAIADGSIATWRTARGVLRIDAAAEA